MLHSSGSVPFSIIASGRGCAPPTAQVGGARARAALARNVSSLARLARNAPVAIRCGAIAKRGTDPAEASGSAHLRLTAEPVETGARPTNARELRVLQMCTRTPNLVRRQKSARFEC